MHDITISEPHYLLFYSADCKYTSAIRQRLEMPHFSIVTSLRSWRDFARECFCFGSEAVNASGEAVRGLVKSPVEFHSRLRREIPRGLSPRGNMRLRRRSPAHESRQLRRLYRNQNIYNSTVNAWEECPPIV